MIIDKIRTLEVLIFASPEPVSDKHIAELFPDFEESEIQPLVEAINLEYESTNRPFRIEHSSHGYKFVTLPEYGTWVRKLIYGNARFKLSRPALETLSLIAYRQPITRIDIESIRGVDCVGMVKSLTERKLIEIKGQEEKTRRSLYGTTEQFLKYFGLKSVSDLPKWDTLTNSEIMQENNIENLFSNEKVDEESNNFSGVSNEHQE